MGTLIRPYDAATDFEGMFQIAREIVSLAPFEEARHELSAYPAKEVRALVALQGDDRPIIGFVAASFPYWNWVAIVDYLVVAPGWRRKGLGTELMERLHEELAAARLRRVCVQTISWNVDGIRFYEKLGYVRLAGLAGYFDDEHDMVWLDRALP